MHATNPHTKEYENVCSEVSKSIAQSIIMEKNHVCNMCLGKSLDALWSQQRASPTVSSIFTQIRTWLISRWERNYLNSMRCSLFSSVCQWGFEWKLASETLLAKHFSIVVDCVLAPEEWLGHGWGLYACGSDHDADGVKTSLRTLLGWSRPLPPLSHWSRFYSGHQQFQTLQDGHHHHWQVGLVLHKKLTIDVKTILLLRALAHAKQPKTDPSFVL